MAARFSLPYFYRDKFTGRPAFTFKRGMIVLEEYGQAQSDVKRAVAGIIREKRVGEHKFPEGCDVLLLSNRPEDRSGVSKDFDFLINRRNQLTVLADSEGWLGWANEHDVTPMSMAFAKRNEEIVFANKAPKVQGPWLTPRSLKMGDDFLKVVHGQDKVPFDDPFIFANLAGIIGAGYAHTYIAFAKIRDKLPRFQEIIDSPTTAPVPREADQAMFLSFELANRATKENFKPIVAYMKRLQSDFSHCILSLGDGAQA